MATQRGLGRGLDALLGSGGGSAVKAEEHDIVNIDVDSIVPNPHQPRVFFSDEAIDELAASIKAQGVLQPILVRSVSEGSYELIAGERRLRAVKSIKQATIPAIVKDLSDDDCLIISIIENLQREDLNPIEEANGLSLIQKKLELSQEELAKKVGKSRPAVANILRLLNLPDGIQDLLIKGSLSSGHARALLSISDTDAQMELAERIVDNNMSVRHVEQYANYWNENGKFPEKEAEPKKQPGKKKISQDKSFKQDFENEFADSLNIKVTIQGFKDQGKVVLHYASEDQLNEIKEILKN